MTWIPPAYVEVKMDAEFSSYVDELAAELELVEASDDPDREEQ